MCTIDNIKSYMHNREYKIIYPQKITLNHIFTLDCIKSYALIDKINSYMQNS